MHADYAVEKFLLKLLVAKIREQAKNVAKIKKRLIKIKRFLFKASIIKTHW